MSSDSGRNQGGRLHDESVGYAHLDLRQVVSEFAQNPPVWQAGEVESDQTVVNAVRDPSQADRQTSLKKWLESYSVLMSYEQEQRTDVCRAILEFADAPGRQQSLLTEEQILSAFKVLERKLSAVAPTNKDGKPRDVTSLCSKALWCCYPEDVPIFDRNARSALGVLARILHISPRNTGSDYAQFLSVWLQVYQHLNDCFADEAEVTRYGFRSRFFDRFLWYLGDPNFSREVKTTASSAGL